MSIGLQLPIIDQKQLLS